MARRKQKIKPATVEELEAHLDMVAGFMHKAKGNAHLYLPIWRALQRELNKLQQSDSLLEQARKRYLRSEQRAP